MSRVACRSPDALGPVAVQAGMVAVCLPSRRTQAGSAQPS